MCREKKFIFIEVPKTGTGSIVRCLMKLDSSLERNKVYLSSGKVLSVSTHATAQEISELLGDSRKCYKFIGFLRSPYDVLASKYYFYKVGRIAEMVKSRRATFGQILRYYSTKMLPLNLWIVIYPYKETQGFIADDRGEVLLDEIGIYESLEKDFLDIFSRMGYRKDHLTLPHLNVSLRSKKKGFLYSSFARLSLWLRSNKDMKLYREALARRGDVDGQ